MLNKYKILKPFNDIFRLFSPPDQSFEVCSVEQIFGGVDSPGPKLDM